MWIDITLRKPKCQHFTYNFKQSVCIINYAVYLWAHFISGKFYQCIHTIVFLISTFNLQHAYLTAKEAFKPQSKNEYKQCM